MGQTRINLKHLLEDIRDGYPWPEEEIIVTELVANALDSGASQVRFETDAAKRTLTVTDNGRGMSRKNLKTYHDIAATTKKRGSGIGFAGIGAKLSLLICEAVVTETRCGRFHQATHWKLETPFRAPWRFEKPLGLVPAPSGTAVCFHLASAQSRLLEPEYLRMVVNRHFSPLFNEKFAETIYRQVYKTDFSFIVDGRPWNGPHGRAGRLFLPDPYGAAPHAGGLRVFGPDGLDQPREEQGLGVATYGKVIKRGWEWMGIRPKNPETLTGLVELPGLASLLTTNKSDFLKDSSSLKQYYRYRKAVLKAVDPALAAMGELETRRRDPHRKTYPSQKEIEQVVAGLVGDFPELTPLLDSRRRAIPGVGEPGGEGGGENLQPQEPSLEETRIEAQEAPPIPEDRIGSQPEGWQTGRVAGRPQEIRRPKDHL